MKNNSTRKLAMKRSSEKIWIAIQLITQKDLMYFVL